MTIKSIDLRLYLNEVTDFDLTRELGSWDLSVPVHNFIVVKEVKNE